jgi:hypothetical protein
MRPRRRWLMIVAGVLVTCVGGVGEDAAFASSRVDPVCGTNRSGPGKVLVFVTDVMGDPIPGVSVSFASEGKAQVSHDTDARGRVILTPSDNAVLQIHVSLPGFQDASASDVRSAPGCATAVAFALPLVHPICEVTVVLTPPEKR